VPFECNTVFYSTDLNTCFTLSLDDDDESQLAIYIIGGAAGLVGLALLLSWLYSRYKEKKYDPDNDPHYNTDDPVVVTRGAKKTTTANNDSQYHDVAMAPNRPARVVTMEEREAAFRRNLPPPSSNASVVPLN
jgi:hypothetical protein